MLDTQTGRVRHLRRTELLNRGCSELFYPPNRFDCRAISSKPILVGAQSTPSLEVFPQHFVTSCSKICLTVSNTPSGWNKVGFVTDLPGFCSNTSRATFQRVGNTLLFKTELKAASSNLGLAQCTMVHTLLDIPSGPGAFLALVQTRIGKILSKI